MTGGAGNDTYVVDDAGDIVTEGAERRHRHGAVVGQLHARRQCREPDLDRQRRHQRHRQQRSPTRITGNTGDNTLDGGAGADSMSGGAGNDTYVVDNAGDTVTELAGEGTDTVQASVSYTLGANVENLTLTGTRRHQRHRQRSPTRIIGNAGNNTLDGGAGADTMTGGAGNDTYVVDDAGDVVTEGASEGIDTVRTLGQLHAAANVENLTLTGNADINGTGNGFANTITGNSGDNTLDGGAGADTMTGGAGNDTYVVDNVGDVVDGSRGEGTDTVQSSVSYTLGANVENLTLTGALAINGTGNAVANVITGNSAANILIGLAGNDMLDGGAGDDTHDRRPRQRHLCRRQCRRHGVENAERRHRHGGCVDPLPARRRTSKT